MGRRLAQRRAQPSPRKIIACIATSGAGYIARSDGGVDRLDRPMRKGRYGGSRSRAAHYAEAVFPKLAVLFKLALLFQVALCFQQKIGFAFSFTGAQSQFRSRAPT